MKNKKRQKKIRILFLGVITFCLIFVFFKTETANAQWYKSFWGNPKEYETELMVKGLIAGNPGMTEDEARQLATGSYFSRTGAWLSGEVLDFLLGAVTKLFEWANDLLFFMVSPRVTDAVFFSDTARRGIMTGWTIVRDFINMFYLLILLFLAISTVLGINKYSDKKLFIGVILSALLVNFSLPITMFVIDISNLIMSFFANALQNYSVGGAVGQHISLQDFWDARKFGNDLVTWGNAGWGKNLSMFFEIIAILVLAVILLVVAITLVIRLIAFWILIILSPLAFFAWAIPGGGLRGMFDNWFKKLISYAFYGPVMLFFLFLTLVLLAALSNSFTQHGSEEVVRTGVSGMMSMIIPYAATIYMLFYGYEQSQKTAAAAGGRLTKMLDKGEKWAKTGLKSSIGVASLGAAPLAMYGATQAAKVPGAVKKTAGEYAGMAMRGIGERLSRVGGSATKEEGEEGMRPFKYLSKSEREKAKKRTEARFKGGDDWSEFQVNEANSKVADIEKQGGKTKDEIEKMLKSKDVITRKAGAILKAKGGHISDVDDMKKIMRETKGRDGKVKNKILQNKLNEEIEKSIQKKAKDGKIKSNEDYEKNIEILRHMENTGMNEEAVEASVGDMTKEVSKKKRASVLNYHIDRGSNVVNTGDKDQLDKEIRINVAMKDMIKKEQSRLRMNGTLGLDEEMNDKMKRSFMRGRFRYNKAAFRDSAYEADAEYRPLKKMMEQDARYLSEEKVQDQLREAQAANHREYNRIVLNNTSPEIRAELVDKGLFRPV